MFHKDLVSEECHACVNDIVAKIVILSCKYRLSKTKKKSRLNVMPQVPGLWVEVIGLVLNVPLWDCRVKLLN